nr:hypothetical protein CFP56_21111 [Quercus suber]
MDAQPAWAISRPSVTPVDRGYLRPFLQLSAQSWRLAECRPERFMVRTSGSLWSPSNSSDYPSSRRLARNGKNLVRTGAASLSKFGSGRLLARQNESTKNDAADLQTRSSLLRPFRRLHGVRAAVGKLIAPTASFGPSCAAHLSWHMLPALNVRSSLAIFAVAPALHGCMHAR